MKTIWKFPLELTDRQSVGMLAGAEILSVQIQGATVCLWAIVEPSGQREERVFEIIGTGQTVWPTEPDRQVRKYIGTVQQGPWVWHVFELCKAVAALR